MLLYGGSWRLSPLAIWHLAADIATNSHSWDYLDTEFSSIIAPIHIILYQDDLNPREAAFIFSSLLNAHLDRFDKLPEGPARTQLIHRTRKIDRVTDSLRMTKNNPRSQHRMAPHKFLNACRAHNKCLKSTKKPRQEEGSTIPRKRLQRKPMALCKETLQG